MYKNKKTQLELKKKVLASFYNSENEDEEKEEEIVTETPTTSNKKTETKVPIDKTTDSNENFKEVLIKNKSLENTNTRNSNKKTHKKKNKNVLDSLTDERLAAYGIDPKKFHKKLKYGDKSKIKLEQDS